MKWSPVSMSSLLSGIAMSISVLWALTPTAPGFSFIFAGEDASIWYDNEDIVTHPIGYSGSGGTLTIEVGIDPVSPHAADMEIPVQNIVHTWNLQQASSGNLKLNSNNNIPSGHLDFESVALHELGHALGLAHPNLASESGLSGNDTNYTKTTDGVDDAFNTAAGADGIIGSVDDVRGDDGNLFWFRLFNNNPFTLDPTVDASTYSRDLADLPAGDLFAANPDRAVATLLGLGTQTTESVMQQGTYYDEAQRDLGHDDVAGIRFAEAGRDETAGNSDDYILQLVYAGLDASADIVIAFDNEQSSFAVTYSEAGQVGNFRSSHYVVSSADIYFNTGFNWFFNDLLLADVDLGVGAMATPSPVVTSSNLVLTLSLTNAGPDVAQASTLSAELGPALHYHAAGSDPGGTVVGQTVSWDVGDLDAASVTSRTLAVFVDGAAGSAVTCLVSSASLGTELQAADNEAVVETAVTDSDNDGQGDFADPDDDNDLMPDSYEVQYGLDPLDAADAAQYADSDPHSNLQEYVADTAPNDPLSKLDTILLPDVDPTIWHLHFTGSVNRVYGVESRSPDGSWTTVISGEPGTGGAMVLSPTNTNNSIMFRLGVDLPSP